MNIKNIRQSILTSLLMITTLTIAVPTNSYAALLPLSSEKKASILANAENVVEAKVISAQYHEGSPTTRGINYKKLVTKVTRGSDIKVGSILNISSGCYGGDLVIDVSKEECQPNAGIIGSTITEYVNKEANGTYSFVYTDYSSRRSLTSIQEPGQLSTIYDVAIYAISPYLYLVIILVIVLVGIFIYLNKTKHSKKTQSKK